MTREEASTRFNALPKNHRVTIIGYELEQEMRWLDRERRDAIIAHRQNIKRINERMVRLEKALIELAD